MFFAAKLKIIDMRKLLTIIAGTLFFLVLAEAQQTKTEVLEKLEHSGQVQQAQPRKGVTMGALRLFGEKDDLTTVIVIVPNGSEVEIIATDEDYLLVRYDDFTGFLIADKVKLITAADTTQQQAVQQQTIQQQVTEHRATQQQVVQQQTTQQQTTQRQTGQQQAVQQQSRQEYRIDEANRLTYLEHKYGRSMANRIVEGKIWKGMTTDMVRDAWGEPDRINRVVVNRIAKEEWIYRSTWLLMEQGKLVEWGPVGK